MDKNAQKWLLLPAIVLLSIAVVNIFVLKKVDFSFPKIENNKTVLTSQQQPNSVFNRNEKPCLEINLRLQKQQSQHSFSTPFLEDYLLELYQQILFFSALQVMTKICIDFSASLFLLFCQFII